MLWKTSFILRMCYFSVHATMLNNSQVSSRQQIALAYWALKFELSADKLLRLLLLNYAPTYFKTSKVCYLKSPRTNCTIHQF